MLELGFPIKGEPLKMYGFQSGSDPKFIIES